MLSLLALSLLTLLPLLALTLLALLSLLSLTLLSLLSLLAGLLPLLALLLALLLTLLSLLALLLTLLTLLSLLALLLTLFTLLSLLSLLLPTLLLAITHPLVDRRQTTHQVPRLIERALFVVRLAASFGSLIGAIETSRQRIEIVGDGLFPVSHIVRRTLSHHATRELDLVAQPAFPHAASGFPQVA